VAEMKESETTGRHFGFGFFAFSNSSVLGRSNIVLKNKTRQVRDHYFLYFGQLST